MEFEKVIRLKHDSNDLSVAMGITPGRWKLCVAKLNSLHNVDGGKASNVLEAIWNDGNFTLEEHILITFNTARRAGTTDLLDKLPPPMVQMVMMMVDLQKEME